MEVPRDDRLSVSGPVFDGTICRLTIAGEMDLATSAALDHLVTSLLTTTPLSRFDLDLSAVTVIDSVGMGILIRARRVLHAQGATIAITTHSHVVRRALEYTGLIHFFEAWGAEEAPVPVGIVVGDVPLVVRLLQGDLTLPERGDLGLRLLQDARTLVPLVPEVPSYLDEQRVAGVNATIERFKQGSRRKLYAVLDALRWADHAQSLDRGVLGAHPEWIALTREGQRSGEGGKGVYLSPYHPEVRALMVRLVRRVAEVLPALDGLVVGCTLSESEVLDFSEAARGAHVRKCRVDPLDINWTVSTDRTDQAILADWASYQRATVTSMVQEIVAAYRERRPSNDVAVLANASLYFRDTIGRGAAGSDWLAWVRSGLFRDVWLYRGTADMQGRGTMLTDALKLLRRASNCPSRSVIDLASASSPEQLNTQIAEARRATDAGVILILREPEHVNWVDQETTRIGEKK